jgi:hypothetical protein
MNDFACGEPFIFLFRVVLSPLTLTRPFAVTTETGPSSCRGTLALSLTLLPSSVPGLIITRVLGPIETSIIIDRPPLPEDLSEEEARELKQEIQLSRAHARSDLIDLAIRHRANCLLKLTFEMQAISETKVSSRQPVSSRGRGSSVERR